MLIINGNCLADGCWISFSSAMASFIYTNTDLYAVRCMTSNLDLENTINTEIGSWGNYITKKNIVVNHKQNVKIFSRQGYLVLFTLD